MSSRIIHVFFFLAVMSLVSPLTSLAQTREWSSKSGYRVQATLQSLEGDSVNLLVEGRDEPVSVPLTALVDDDAKFAQQAWFNLQDKRQFELVVEHLRSVQERPKTVVNLLLEIHNTIPESPYAGLWAAVAMSEGTNDFSRAATILRQVISRIEAQQKVSESRHTMTLVSASNNLAICYIKNRRGDSAAAQFINAIESRKVTPPVVRSNAELLNELAGDAKALIKYTDAAGDRLMRSLAFSETSGAGTSFEVGWHYSLDFDLPSDSTDAQKQDGIDAPRSDLQLLAQGTGFVVAPGIVLTSKRVVETTNYNGPKLVTLVTNPTEQAWRSEIVQNVMIESVKSVATGGTTQTGSLTLRGKTATTQNTFTDYSYVRSPDGHVGAEIAALRVPNLRIKPLAIAVDAPLPNGDCIIWGFGRGKDNVNAGLRKETGKVLSGQTIRGNGYGVSSQFTNSRVVLTSARVLGGNRGGPLTNAANMVQGIAFDTPNSTTQASGWFFGADEIRRWFYRNVQTSSLTDADPNVNPDELEAAIETATLPVFVWGQRQTSDVELFSLAADTSRNSGGIYIRDGWCIACDGRGFLKCPNKGCNRGVVAKPKRQVIGNDPVTGAPIMGNKFYKEKCGTCNGKGGSVCPHCKSGRL